VSALDWTPPEGMDPAVKTSWRAFYLGARAKYGVTPGQYRDMYVAQHGCCYICRVAKGINPDDPKGRGTRRLGVDHNHLTGAVRGLLCTGSLSANTCNRLIARYNIQALRRAIEVLEREPFQTVIAYGRDNPDATDSDMRKVLGLS
jgi:hypothetical protein